MNGEMDTWSGDLEMSARNNCLRSLTSKESFVVLGNGVLVDTRNASERFVHSVGIGLNFRRDAKRLR